MLCRADRPRRTGGRQGADHGAGAGDEPGDCRRANIDPGLLSIESLVLATTKYAGHRVCIAPQLYAEVTLLYQRGRYRPLEWTYPDYQGDAVQRFLLDVRPWLLECAAEVSPARRVRQMGGAPARCRCGWGG